MSFLGLGIGLALTDERGDSNTVDFSAFPVGTPLPAGVLPGGGAYTQAAGSNQTEETVRTGLSTVARWSFVANMPRIGLLADGGTGLVLEPPRTNDPTFSEALESAAWTATAGIAVAANTGDVTDMAAGSRADKVTYDGSGAAGGFRLYDGLGTGTTGAFYTTSWWLRTLSGTLRVDISDNVTAQMQPTITGSWGRYSYSSAAWPAATLRRVMLYSPGGINTAFTVYGGGAQSEQGKYASNLIPTTNVAAGRAGFSTPYPISRFVRAGKFLAEIVTVPFGSCTDYDADSASIRLWTIDANTYAEINTTTRVLTVSVNGVARVAGVPVWWLVGHRIAWSWEVGDGNLRVRYRLSTDKGLTWTLPFDPFGGVVNVDAAISTVATSVHLWSDSGTSKWFGNGEVSNRPLVAAPAWALQWLPTDDANVKAWFRADGHYTLASGLVSAWQSQNTGVSATQGTGAFQPTFGAALVNSRPGFDFDGTNDSLAIAGLTVGSGDLLVSAALNIVATLGVDLGAILIDSLTGRMIAAIRATATSDNLGYFDNIAWRSVAVAPVTGTQVLTYDMRVAPGGRVYKDGVQQGAAQTYSAIGISGQTAIGSSYNNTGSWMRARLGDFVVASSQNDALRNNLHAFYALKYGLTVA